MKHATRTIYFVCFFVSLLFITSCSDDDKDFGSITGVITDANGEGLSGVEVTLMPGEKVYTTAENGSYKFAGLSPQEYLISVEKPIYESKSQKVNVTAKETTTQNFTLARYSSINFNNILEKPDTEYIGHIDENSPDGTYIESTFTDPKETATFNHYAVKGRGYFGGGFTYTNKTDVEDYSYFNVSAITGKGYLGDTYLTCNSSQYNPAFIELNENSIIQGFYITNTTYAYGAMEYGNDFAKKFTEKDYFKVIIKGILGEVQTEEVEVYLAKDGKIVDEWEWVDLTSLGSVDMLTFDFESSDNDEIWGINTPTYFSMDALTLIP